MSFATSRAFNACRSLLAPAKSGASAAKKTVPKEKPKAEPKTKRAAPPAGTGILKPIPLSPALREFLGVPEASRTDAVKMNPENKKIIICDEKLKAIFNGKDTVGFLEIAKLLSQHFVKNN